MYFELPKSQDRQTQKSLLSTKSSNSSMLSSTESVMADERISEIIQNIDDHWGSPPILTPNTLAHILDHQWVHEDTVSQEELKKVSKAAAKAQRAKSSNKVISALIEEFCKTLQDVDTENKFDVTNDIKNDPIIQKFMENKEGLTTGTEGEEKVMQHLIGLLQARNSNKHPPAQ